MIHGKKIILLIALLAIPVLALPSFINNTGGAAIATRDGNVSVGNVSQSLGKLHVSGGNVYQDATLTPRVLGSITSIKLDGADNVYVSGKYAYVVSFNNKSLTILDVSNPLSPSIVGYVTDTRLSGARYIRVSGKYAYIASQNNDSLTIIDISNSSSPTITGSVTSVRLEGSRSFYVSGKYAYVTGSINDSLNIIDISNSSSPTIIGFVIDTRIDGASYVYVSGKYAYVTGSVNDSLSIIDISNSSSPTITGSVTDARLNEAYGVYVSGRYAYVAAFSNSSLTIIDISNSSSPTITGQVSVTERLNGAYDVYVSGRYAYVAARTSDSLTIIDVSNPSSPFIVVSVTSAHLDGANGVYVSGKYAYVASQANNSLTILDISGIDSPSASIGAIETGSLSVTENANIANDLYVGSGLSVGPNGIFSQGPLAILSSAGDAALRIIKSTSDIFYIATGGRVGVNTSTPTSLLYVNGNTNVTGTLYAANCIGCVASGVMLADVSDPGITGDSTNVTINFTAGFNQTWAFAFYLNVNSSNPQTDDAYFTFSVPSQSSCIRTITGPGGTLVDQGWQSSCSIGLVYNVSTLQPDGVVLHGTIITGNFTGLVTVQFATGGSIGMDILKGSSFTATRIV